MGKKTMYGGNDQQGESGMSSFFTNLFKGNSSSESHNTASHSNISLNTTHSTSTHGEKHSSGLTFQKIVAYIAAIVLAGTLTVIGFLIYKSKSDIKYPPDMSDCPDYWDTISPNKCKNNMKLGNCDIEIMDFNQPKYSGPQGKVEKCKWANECGLTWDGLKC